MSARRKQPPFGSRVPGTQTSAASTRLRAAVRGEITRVEHADGSVSLTFFGPSARRLGRILEDQRDAFVTKFGRLPDPNDPVFFDPDADYPTALTEEKMRSMLAAELRSSRFPESIVRAFEVTGLLVTSDNMHLCSDEELAAWLTAVLDDESGEGPDAVDDGGPGNTAGDPHGDEDGGESSRVDSGG